MKMLKAGLMAIALLLGSTAAAKAADICFDVTITASGGGVGTNSVINPSATNLLIGRAFGLLPGAGACKDFRGFIPGTQTVWATGQGCGSSDNVDVSFFLPVVNPTGLQFGSLFFPLTRSTLAGVGLLCTTNTGLPGYCQPATVAKVACPSGVTIPEGTLPFCPGVC